MSDMVVESRSQEAPCPNCGTASEPEQDGDHMYYSCGECGMDFGWERVPQAAVTGDSSGACSIGVPESVRRAASKFSDRAMAGLDQTIPLPPETVPVMLKRKE